jgi:hypothetical protein
MVIGSKHHANLMLTLSVVLAVIQGSSKGQHKVIVGQHKVKHEDNPVDKPEDKSQNDR